MTSEYPRLFNERFPPQQLSDSRPSSSGSVDEQDETAWLNNTIGDNTNEEGSWDRVEGVEPGALTLQFDDVLALDRRASQGVRI